jgi:hypothetical protein
MIESGGLSNLQIEIFALEGDFPHASPKSWTAKKFNKHRANARDGRGNVLAGEGMKAQLKNGQCDLGSIKFTENSCKARNQKFIIGARVSEGELSGVQVREAVMNPVSVQDRRNKGWFVAIDIILSCCLVKLGLGTTLLIRCSGPRFITCIQLFFDDV